MFVKFGQMLSTRRDLLPPDIADELAKLQDRVPPFPAEQVLATLAAPTASRSTRCSDVRPTPVASASVAQVHFAELPNGTPVAVKVLPPGHPQSHRARPGADAHGGGLVETLWADGKRLRPRDVVGEFEKTIRDELDLTREAANCSQLRRNFRIRRCCWCRKSCWDWTTQEVLVMERMAASRSDGSRTCAARASTSGGWRARASSSSSRRCSATASSTRTCTRATSSSRSTVEPRQVHRARLRHRGHAVRDPTRATSRRISSRSSAATTTASRPRTSNRAGCRPTRASTSSRRRSASCWSRSSTARCREISLGKVLM